MAHQMSRGTFPVEGSRPLNHPGMNQYGNSYGMNQFGTNFPTLNQQTGNQHDLNQLGRYQQDSNRMSQVERLSRRDVDPADQGQQHAVTPLMGQRSLGPYGMNNQSISNSNLNERDMNQLHIQPDAISASSFSFTISGATSHRGLSEGLGVQVREGMVGVARGFQATPDSGHSYQFGNEKKPTSNPWQSQAGTSGAPFSGSMGMERKLNTVEHTKSDQNSVNTESATSILASFGLTNDDLKELSSYPDEALTPQNMPIILKNIRLRKAGLLSGKTPLMDNLKNKWNEPIIPKVPNKYGYQEGQSEARLYSTSGINLESNRMIQGNVYSSQSNLPSVSEGSLANVSTGQSTDSYRSSFPRHKLSDQDTFVENARNLSGSNPYNRSMPIISDTRRNDPPSSQIENRYNIRMSNVSNSPSANIYSAPKPVQSSLNLYNSQGVYMEKSPQASLFGNAASPVLRSKPVGAVTGHSKPMGPLTGGKPASFVSGAKAAGPVAVSKPAVTLMGGKPSMTQAEGRAAGPMVGSQATVTINKSSKSTSVTVAKAAGGTPVGGKFAGGMSVGDKTAAVSPAGSKAAGTMPVKGKAAGDTQTGVQAAGTKQTGVKPVVLQTGNKVAGGMTSVTGGKATGAKGVTPTGAKTAVVLQTGSKSAGGMTAAAIGKSACNTAAAGSKGVGKTVVVSKSEGVAPVVGKVSETETIPTVVQAAGAKAPRMPQASVTPTGSKPVVSSSGNTIAGTQAGSKSVEVKSVASEPAVAVKPTGTRAGDRATPSGTKVMGAKTEPSNSKVVVTNPVGPKGGVGPKASVTTLGAKVVPAATTLAAAKTAATPLTPKDGVPAKASAVAENTPAGTQLGVGLLNAKKAVTQAGVKPVVVGRTPPKSVQGNPSSGVQAGNPWSNRVPPLMGDRVPPLMGDRVPPLMGDRVPPLMGDRGMPHMWNRGMPPMGDRGMPPMGDRGMPPMGDRGMPPMGDRGMPPMGDRGMPPMGDRGMPPMGDRGMPPMGVRGMPPMGDRGMPPMGDHGMPPMGYRGMPPMGDRGMPPMGDRGMPPMGDRGMPPMGDRGMPPMGDRGMLPMGDRGMPPMGDRGMPPMGDRGMPPMGDRGMPPMGDRGMPLMGDRGMPLMGDRGMPPMGDRGMPPMGDRGMPPMGDRGMPPMGDRGMPPMGDRGMPPMGVRGMPPMGDRGMPPMGDRGMPPMGDRGMPPMGDRGMPPMGDRGMPPMGDRGMPPMGDRGMPPMGDRGMPPMGDRGISPMPLMGDRGISPMPPMGDRGISPMPPMGDRGISPMPPMGDRGMPPMGDRGISPMPLMGDRGIPPMPPMGSGASSHWEDRKEPSLGDQVHSLSAAQPLPPNLEERHRSIPSQSAFEHSEMQLGQLPDSSIVSDQIKNDPTTAMLHDYKASMPRIFPHSCSLCNILTRNFKDWTNHQNSDLHLAKCRHVRERYPQWFQDGPGEIRDETLEANVPQSPGVRRELDNVEHLDPLKFLGLDDYIPKMEREHAQNYSLRSRSRSPRYYRSENKVHNSPEGYSRSSSRQVARLPSPVRSRSPLSLRNPNHPDRIRDLRSPRRISRSRDRSPRRGRRSLSRQKHIRSRTKSPLLPYARRSSLSRSRKRSRSRQRSALRSRSPRRSRKSVSKSRSQRDERVSSPPKKREKYPDKKTSRDRSATRKSSISSTSKNPSSSSTSGKNASSSSRSHPGSSSSSTKNEKSRDLQKPGTGDSSKSETDKALTKSENDKGIAKPGSSTAKPDNKSSTSRPGGSSSRSSGTGGSSSRSSGPGGSSSRSLRPGGSSSRSSRPGSSSSSSSRSSRPGMSSRSAKPGTSSRPSKPGTDKTLVPHSTDTAPTKSSADRTPLKAKIGNSLPTSVNDSGTPVPSTKCALSEMAEGLDDLLETYTVVSEVESDYDSDCACQAPDSPREPSKVCVSPVQFESNTTPIDLPKSNSASLDMPAMTSGLSEDVVCSTECCESDTDDDLPGNLEMCNKNSSGAAIRKDSTSEKQFVDGGMKTTRLWLESKENGKKVVQLSSLPNEFKKEDVEKAVAKLGVVCDTLIVPNVNEAYLEMESEEIAVAAVERSKIMPVLIKEKAVHLRWGKKVLEDSAADMGRTLRSFPLDKFQDFISKKHKVASDGDGSQKQTTSVQVKTN